MFLRCPSQVLLALFALPLIFACALAQAQTYASGFGDATWSNKSGAFACSLSHPIAGLGSAYFGQNAGAAGFFEFRNAKKSFAQETVKLEAVPPQWRADLSPEALFSYQAAASLRLNSAQAGSVATALARGTNVVFSGAKGLRVIVDARNFAPAYMTYQRCVSELIPYSFSQLSPMTIQYAKDALVLSASAKAQLDKIARYSKADPAVLGILVDTHSDKRASPEEAELAAQQQAELVSDYLVEQGLAASLITARWHGDKFPIASNNNLAGQAKNRRITLRLENQSTRKERELRVAALKAAEQKAAEQEAAKVAAEATPNQSPAPDPAAITPAQLEQLVEQQDLNSARSPQ